MKLFRWKHHTDIWRFTGTKQRAARLEGADHTFNKFEWEQEVIEKTVEF